MSRSVAEVYLSRWPESSDTYVTMRSALNRIAGALEEGATAETYPWHEMRFEDARRVPALLSKLEPATINKLLSALRGVLETAKDMRLLPEEEFARIQIKSVRGDGDEAGRALSDAEKDAILAKLPSLSTFEAAAIAIMLGAGARRVEVVQIKRDDYDAASCRITLYGKGRKKRKVPVGKSWRPFIEALQREHAENDLLFPITRKQVSGIVTRLSAAIGGVEFTPHDLRRTFGTYICKVADVAIAQRLLGHSDVKTTLLYDRRGEDAEDDAVKDW